MYIHIYLSCPINILETGKAKEDKIGKIVSMYGQHRHEADMDMQVEAYKQKYSV
jgi:hypothetical protein